MKSKASLSMMELVIMILVFAIAATVCVRIFVHAEITSLDQLHRDDAMLLCENLTETLKSNGGNIRAAAKAFGTDCSEDAASLRLCFDASLQPCAPGDAAYFLNLVLNENGTYAAEGTLNVISDDGKLLYSMVSAWQKAAGKEAVK